MNRFASLLALVSFVLLSGNAQAQDRMLERLPYAEGLFVWTDDFPRLLENIQSLQPENVEQWQAVWEYANSDTDQEDGDPEGRAALQGYRGQQLISLLSIWQQLSNDKLFEGEVGLHVSNEDDTDVFFMAKSSSERAEIEQFVSSLNKALASSLSESPEAEKQAEQATIPNAALAKDDWVYEEGWFCVCSDQELRSVLLSYLTGETKAKITVADDRTFQRCFAQLKDGRRDKPALSFYATAETLPRLGESLSEVSELFYNASREEWSDVYLDTIRCLGARIYLNDDFIKEETDAMLGVEAFAVVTQPRRGVLRATQKNRGSALDTSWLTPRLPLIQYMQLKMDGDEFQAGILEVMEKSLRDQDIPAEVVAEQEQMSEMFGLMNSIASTKASSDSSGDPFRQEMMAIKLSDPNQFGELMTKNLPQELERKPLSEFGERYQDFEGSEAYGFGASKASIEAEMAAALDRLEDFQKQLEGLKERGDGGEEAEQQIQILESQVAQQRQMIKFVEQQQSQAMMIGVGEWVYPDVTLATDAVDLDDLFGEKHPQLLTLQDDLKKLEKAFGAALANTGVFAIWGDQLADSLASSSKSYYLNSSEVEMSVEEYEAAMATPVESIGQGLAPAKLSGFRQHRDQQNRQLGELMIRQLERSIFAIDDSREGFRFSGIVIQDRKGEEEELFDKD